MSVDLKKLIIGTIRTIGYTKILEENITRNNILDLVSYKTGIPRSNIKKMCDYKKIIDDEIHIMEEYENENSDDEPLNAVISRIKSLKVSSNNEYDSGSDYDPTYYEGVEETKDYTLTRDSDMNDIDDLPDIRYRDILRPGRGGETLPIADWLTTKDLVNLTGVNKATRESSIFEITKKTRTIIFRFRRFRKIYKEHRV